MNPLLSTDFRIPFDRIHATDVVPGVREALSRARAELDALTASTAPRTYANTIQALDDLVERLDRVIGPVVHLISVETSPELREAYQTVLPEFSAFYASLPLDEALWRAVRDFAAAPEAAALTGVRKRHLEKTMRGFERAGAELPPAQKERAREILVELSELEARFEDNTLDATNAFELWITDVADLAGLPPSALARARESAQTKGRAEGWRFTLQAPSYLPFMQYAESRELRRQMQQTFVARAAGGEHDNRPLIARILELRRELARLLGYRDFADFRLAEDMAESGAAALAFEERLAERTRPFWEREAEELRAVAREELGLDRIEPWDVAFAIERMRRARFDLDEEELRPYFPLESVLAGLFEIARRLFGITVAEREIAEVWNPQVRYYDVHTEDGAYLGSFYADWFPRESKRGGAWMDAFITGGPRAEDFAPHLGLMVGNFTPPADGKPALLTHREVETTFHEFGHLLHHLLSTVEVVPRAGTNVSRDWVELPSQIMENWAWERDALDLFARHYETNEPIPEALFEKMRAARTFMGAYHQMRQLNLGLIDLSLHVRYDAARDGDPVEYANAVMQRFMAAPEFARSFSITTFTHVFAGGYAARYYSYLWSEVLDADAFTRFRREGIFNRETGRAWVEAVLSKGDSEDPAELFRAFMGRDPDPDALLARNLGARGAEV
jgi:oligopeptidase A